jgi:NADH-quinone oxidoreductase subunit J
MEMLLSLLILLVFCALWTVLTPLLLRAAIALALTSAVLTIIMFQLGAPYAAVFELSVCAGLIPVIFISVISLMNRQPFPEQLRRRNRRIRRFILLPFILVAAALLLFFIRAPLDLKLLPAEAVNDMRVVMWDFRRMDLFGQIAALLAGAFGVLILFRGKS